MSQTTALQIVTLVLGIGVCTGAGLLSLVPDPERPAKFVPVYAVAVALFLAGLAALFWFQPIGTYLAEQGLAW